MRVHSHNDFVSKCAFYNLRGCFYQERAHSRTLAHTRTLTVHKNNTKLWKTIVEKKLSTIFVVAMSRLMLSIRLTCTIRWNEITNILLCIFLKLLISKFCTTTMPMIITQNCHCQKQPNLFSYTAVCSVKWLMIFDWLHSHHDVNIRIYAQFNAHKKEFPETFFNLQIFVR